MLNERRGGGHLGSSEGEQIASSNCFDLYHELPDSGERQRESSI